MDRKDHWEDVYSSKPANRLGWYEPHLEISLNWIRELLPGKTIPLIDVGGGASTLVDDLVEGGYRSVTVVDISGKALARTRKRLGDNAESVKFIEGDITELKLPEHFYGLWHDRAVFHFLIEEEDRKKYISNLQKSVIDNGYVVIGTFAPEAPPRCSGLPVERYDANSLGEVLGEQFEMLDNLKDMHITPGGVEQMYLYCKFKKLPSEI